MTNATNARLELNAIIRVNLLFVLLVNIGQAVVSIVQQVKYAQMVFIRILQLWDLALKEQEALLKSSCKFYLSLIIK